MEYINQTIKKGETMKKITTILGIILMTTTVFGLERAGKDERIFLCAAVNKMLSDNAVDAGLDVEKCIAESEIDSSLITEGVRNVQGTLTFRSPGRSHFDLVCTAAYYEKAEVENIIGGIESVTCN
jgi:hypothetical protein